MSDMTEKTDNYVEFTAARTDSGLRADVFTALAAQLSRSAAGALIDSGKVSVNGVAVRRSYKMNEGDRVEVCLPEPELCQVLPENIPLSVVYEDSDVIVVNKPQGMVVHPAPGHSTGTLVSALMWHCGNSLSDINGVIRPGIVHRIDRDTSGLIAVAKNNAAHLSLAAQLEDHSLSRVYTAIVRGRLGESGTVEAAIGRHKTDRKKMAVTADGRRAVTHYRSLEELPGFTLAQMNLETGRTHQIRVHMSYIGHPILGDPVYSTVTAFEKKHPALFHGQCLHAGSLSFNHPSSGERITVSCPPPDNFSRILELLRAGER